MGFHRLRDSSPLRAKDLWNQSGARGRCPCQSQADRGGPSWPDLDARPHGHDAPNLSDLGVGDGNAARRPVGQAVQAPNPSEAIGEPMQHDRPAWAATGATGARAVPGIGIGDMKAKVEGTARIARVDQVVAFRGAPVSLADFGAHSASSECHRVRPQRLPVGVERQAVA